MATFEIFKAEDTMRPLWFWHLIGDNGEIMSQSEAYTTKQHAERAVERFKAIVPDAEIKDLETK